MNYLGPSKNGEGLHLSNHQETEYGAEQNTKRHIESLVVVSEFHSPPDKQVDGERHLEKPAQIRSERELQQAKKLHTETAPPQSIKSVASKPWRISGGLK